tara:strand:+ start:462 stop:617 length:156 start_codon:yes stop_codon:yes gene_type:complete
MTQKQSTIRIVQAQRIFGKDDFFSAAGLINTLHHQASCSKTALTSDRQQSL